MRYVKEPWKNRVLGGGWSHNPYKPASREMLDPDAVATEIADKYIRLITERFHKSGMMPMTGVEVNFAAHGVPDTAIIDYVNAENARARGKLSRQRPSEIETLLAALQATPVCSNDMLDVPLETFEQTNKYFTMAERARKEGAPDLSVISKARYFAREGMLEYITDESGLVINPKFHELLVRYAQALETEYVVARNKGAISRAYIDDFTQPDHIDAPELTTPPRSPELTVRQVNTIKRLLMESTYRFHGSDAISPTAKRMHEAIGDYDISFIDPAKYYNLAEQVNFSLQLMKPGNESYQAVRRSSNFGDNNFMDSPEICVLFAKAFARYLPAERLLTVGNRFPFDEAKQRGDAHIHVRDSRDTRVGGRVEICDFHDACSNISLSMLGVLSVGYFTLLSMIHHRQAGVTVRDILDAMEKDLPTSSLPKTPWDAVEQFNDGMTLKVMLSVGVEDAMKRGLSESAAMDEVNSELQNFFNALAKRQQLLVKAPWGGSARAARKKPMAGKSAIQSPQKRKAPRSKPSRPLLSMWKDRAIMRRAQKG